MPESERGLASIFQIYAETAGSIGVTLMYFRLFFTLPFLTNFTSPATFENKVKSFHVPTFSPA